ncbi:MAG TPA: DUF998 domain-containing protein [Gammaproteobacteria bacterium]
MVPAAVTRSLLGCGVLVGAFYVAVGVGQGLIRDGFSFARHPLSVLANGPGGWVQTANFVVSALMVLAAVAGMARVGAERSRGMRGALVVYALGMIAAAIFPTDPIDGFPPGTPLGVPTAISTSGLVHLVAGAVTFVAMAVACWAGARTMAKRGERGLSRLSLLAGFVVFLGFFGGAAFSSSVGGVAGIWLAVVMGWAWLAIVSRYYYYDQVSPTPSR